VYPQSFGSFSLLLDEFDFFVFQLLFFQFHYIVPFSIQICLSAIYCGCINFTVSIIAFTFHFTQKLSGFQLVHFSQKRSSALNLLSEVSRIGSFLRPTLFPLYLGTDYIACSFGILQATVMQQDLVLFGAVASYLVHYLNLGLSHSKRAAHIPWGSFHIYKRES